jgi:demethylmenaquinone methyltransferase/2-methoxy-6-polyprenyl-1,4-benzoquinol methylase
MFDRIVPRYDLMNRIMTGGRDVAWRRLVNRIALRALTRADECALDIATGTGDIAIALRRAGAEHVVGLDFSAPMLAAAQAKERALHGASSIAWVEADAMALPLGDASINVVTVGFGLRNMPSYAGALREMARVLRPGGRLVCLETTPQRNPLLRAAFSFYLSRVVPRLGSIIGGDRDAYSYLPASAASFPDADALGRMMLGAGFSRVRYRRLGGGAVALHVAVK